MEEVAWTRIPSLSHATLMGRVGGVGHGEYLTARASLSPSQKPQVSHPSPPASASPDGGLLPPETPFWQYPNKTSAY